MDMSRWKVRLSIVFVGSGADQMGMDGRLLDGPPRVF